MLILAAASIPCCCYYTRLSAVCVSFCTCLLLSPPSPLFYFFTAGSPPALIGLVPIVSFFLHLLIRVNSFFPCTDMEAINTLLPSLHLSVIWLPPSISSSTALFPMFPLSVQISSSGVWCNVIFCLSPSVSAVAEAAEPVSACRCGLEDWGDGGQCH